MSGSGVCLRGRVVISKINKVVFLCNCMVEIKEVKDTAEELVEDDVEDDLDEVEGGIFDEDLEGFDADDGTGGFDIGTTLLTAAAPVESWSGQNLEDTISREHVEKDWGDDEKFAGGDFYKSSESSDDVYSSPGGDVYGAQSGSDIYSGSGEGPYSSGKDGEGAYSAPGGRKGEMKSYDQLKDERRGNMSMLEASGFEDKQKNKHTEFTRDFVAYDAGKAA